MLDIKFIRENPAKVKENIRNKNEKADIDAFLSLDGERKNIIAEAEQLKSQRNTVSKLIANLKKNKEDATEQISAMKQVSGRIKILDDNLRNVESELRNIQLQIPNILHDSVPIGKTEEDNKFIRSYGEILQPPHGKNHIEIATELGLIDFKRGAKVSGAGFTFYTGKGAALERALINFMLDFHVEKNGYYELMPPFMVNEKSMTGTGQLPKMDEDMYKSPEDGMYMIPTAEVPLTNFFAGQILQAGDLPKKICAYSPCFRREAGSYGKEVHGLIRVHQFNKVEMVKLSKPEDSDDELEALVVDAESILQALGLPYRVILLCSGDTSFASAMTYDLEVWAPGEKKWLEVSSCSNFGDFQARRAGIRFKRTANSKPEFVHTLNGSGLATPMIATIILGVANTLNGSGLATPRIMVAIIETFYSKGRIELPEVLKKYCSFDFI